MPRPLSGRGFHPNCPSDHLPLTHPVHLAFHQPRCLQHPAQGQGPRGISGSRNSKAPKCGCPGRGDQKAIENERGGRRRPVESGLRLPLPHPQLQTQGKGRVGQETRKCEMLLSAKRKKEKQVFKEHKVSAKEVMGPFTLKSMASSLDSRRPSGEREMRKVGKRLTGWGRPRTNPDPSTHVSL